MITYNRTYDLEETKEALKEAIRLFGIVQRETITSYNIVILMEEKRKDLEN